MTKLEPVEITLGGKTYRVEWVDDLVQVSHLLQSLPVKPKWFTFDTETSGLHIKKDRAFLGAVAWHTDTERVAYVFPTKKNPKAPKSHWNNLVNMSEQVTWIVAHNTVYDMHMLANEAGEDVVYAIKNWGDCQGLLRLVFEAVSPSNGGEKLALKTVSKRFVDPDADKYEAAVKGWLKAKKAADRKVLIALLKQHKWTMKRFEEATNAGSNEEVPAEVLNTYFQWLRDFPEPNYGDVPMEIMLPYVASDVILTDLVVDMSVPIVTHRKQWGVIKREFKNLKSTFKMTRRGFRVDRDYLEESAVRLDDYIEDLNITMHSLAGRQFTVGQHEVIKDIYEERLGKRPASTNKEFMKKQMDQGDELAKYIRKLRTLEKWRSTYVGNILKGSAYDGIFYAGLNQFGAVSGRYSGDFQQMPKDPLLTFEGDEQKKANGGKWTPGEGGCDPAQELFYPRKAIINREGSRMFYLDFSQEELRFQAHFTLFLGGDLNLCRAYMPFQCVHYVTGETYSYHTAAGRDRWKECREGSPVGYWEDVLKAGHSAWVVPETGKPWIPTDVHGSTAEKALKLMGIDVTDLKVFKYWRQIGKTYNFMKTYGGGPKKSAEVLDITFEQCKAIDDGFLISFPVIPKYQDSIVNTVCMQGYITNMFDRKYYISDTRKAYKLANYNIQGSCADDLKEKILIVDKFFEEKQVQSQILMPVHDELIFEIFDGEEWVVPHLCEMMMHSPKLLIPLVVEPDFTNTNWAEKEAYHIA